MRGMVFNIQDYCIHDGPGIRTTVFLKGCPLRCQWCSNPESMNSRPQLGFIKMKCTKCGKCVSACTEGAMGGAVDEIPQIDRERCTNCGKCVEVCGADALAVYGKEMTTEELFEAVRKDEIFYRGSGGGVTVSGGEPLQQPEFVCEFFDMCRGAAIHTAIETTGHTTHAVLERVLTLTDYVLFDLKHLNSIDHRRYTGQPNELILENAERVAASGVPVLFRMPLVPGINDTDLNIQATAAFLQRVWKGAGRLELLAYHRLGMGKYEGLGKSYRLESVRPPERSHVEAVRNAFEKLGVSCTVSQ
jgi:pyruvate formate lyase activating enzyme